MRNAIFFNRITMVSPVKHLFQGKRSFTESQYTVNKHHTQYHSSELGNTEK